MRDISAELLSHIQGDVLTIATLWKVTPVGESAEGFTDHHADISYDGVTYAAATGYTRSAISSSVGLDVDSLNVEGLIDDADVLEEDLRAGKYDGAAVEIFIVNYKDLTMGRLMLKAGYFGEVALRDRVYVVELRGLTQLLGREILREYSGECSADFGDSLCNFAISAPDTKREDVAVSAVSSSQVFTAGALTNATIGDWAFGRVTWITGSNAGRSMEIKSWNNGTKVITLFLPMAYAIQIGDTFDIEAGCDKSVATCRDTFSNLDNYRGFPFIPTLREILEYPDDLALGFHGIGS